MEFLTFFLGVGLKEVILAPLALFLFRKSLSLLPKVFDRLDPTIPEDISKLTPEELEKNIHIAIEGVAATEGVKLSEKGRNRLYKEFIRLYDPIKAATKVGN